MLARAIWADVCAGWQVVATRRRRCLRASICAAMIASVLVGACAISSEGPGATAELAGASSGSAAVAAPRRTSLIVTITEIVGPPTEISVRLRGKLIDAASEARVLLVENGSATVDYVVTGRVRLERKKSVVNVTSVWEVSDGKGRHVGRSEGSQSVGNRPLAGAWKGVTDDVLFQVARQAMVAVQSVGYTKHASQ